MQPRRPLPPAPVRELESAVLPPAPLTFTEAATFLHHRSRLPDCAMSNDGNEPLPAAWRDTPAKRQRWGLLQSSNRFLRSEEDASGSLSCHYCGTGPLRIYSWDDSNGRNAPDKATTDHVIPLSRGGPDSADNMVVSCFPCNQRKGVS
ncbi:hypothetical protein PLESTF_001499200 [Pleodorina starrii]|nr:hypothetical protein PLESTF_001499200 [Pleodorina starrii]